MKTSAFWQCLPNFYPEAQNFRDHFDTQFANPLLTKEERFCWDYWYVKDQYKLMRTPAEHFFPKSMYDKFESHLRHWGQKKLGCQNISPMWLSYYIDGCEQQLHSDAPHGPWAFVYSLTHWEERIFTGGETFLLKPETLCFWDFFDQSKGVEKKHLIETIPPLFNQLSVFDPRLPHGVQPVRGAHDPKEARIVIHGWFTEPGPSVTGSLETKNCINTLNKALEPLHKELSNIGVLSGLLSLQLNVTQEGVVESLETLSNTLIEINCKWGDDDIIDFLTKNLAQIQFEKSSGPSEIIIPFLFN